MFFPALINNIFVLTVESDSLDFIQWVSGPTQGRGHTLDPILSYFFFVSNWMICGTVCGTVFSDHKLVSFDIALLCSSIKPHVPARRCDIINPSTAVHFSAYFNQNRCREAQLLDDAVALLKSRDPKTKSEP